jgi:hypothetical protein
MMRNLLIYCAGSLGIAVSACMLIDPVEKPAEAGIAAGGAGGTAGVGGEAAAGTGNGGAAGGGDSGSGGSAGAPECTTNLDCFNAPGRANEPARCRSDGRCASLRTPECPVVLTPGGKPSYNDDNALFIGAYARNPAVVSARPEDSTIAWNYQLALDEMSGEAKRGLPDVETGQDRPVVVVVCNNNEQQAQANANLVMNGFKHLVDELEVPAVVAALLPDDMFDVLAYGVPKTVFLISPQGATKGIAGYEDADLAWHMLGQPAQMAPVYAEVLEQLELHVKARPGRASMLKVATVSTAAAFDTDLQEAALPALRWNGKAAMANLSDGQLLSSIITPENRVSEVARILAFAPDIVISFAGTVFTDVPGGIIAGIESTWGGLHTELEPPYYVLSPINQGDQLNVETLISTGAGVFGPNTYQRFLGVSVAPPRNRTLYEDYLFRLHTAFPLAFAETENYYDAMTYLLYAMYASGSLGDLTGRSIATGMWRLIRGSEIHQVGPTTRAGVLNALDVTGKNIWLVGTLGDPRFESTGVRIDEASVFCFDSAPNQLNHALRYDRTGGVLVQGSATCPFYVVP